MPRQKLLSDEDVLAQARRLFAAGGDKAVSFGALSRATGLAASTLAQRFTNVEGLQAAAAMAGWRGLIHSSDAASAASAGKGPQAYLKALERDGVEAVRLMVLGARSTEANDLAIAWRARVEATLALRLGQGEKARHAAQALFLAWQGQVMWGRASEGQELKLKDLAKRLI